MSSKQSIFPIFSHKNTMLHQEWRSPDPKFSNPTPISAAFVDSITQPDCGRKGSAKAYLHHLCSAKQWNQPLFECCNEEGPSHNKLFTFKVSIHSEEGCVIVESFGNNQTSKKAAAEDAAEGALWCLKHMGISW